MDELDQEHAGEVGGDQRRVVLVAEIELACEAPWHGAS